MTWYFKGGKVFESEIYDLISTLYSEGDYEEFLNENHSLVEVCGSTFEQGTALRKLDYTSFREGYLDECNYIATEIIRNEDEEDAYGFGFSWVEE